MGKPVAYRFKSPLSEEGQWEYGKEPPIGSRWEIEGLYRMQVNVPRTPLEKAAKEMLRCVDRMLRDGEWYAAQEKADALRAALIDIQAVAEFVEDASCRLTADPINPQRDGIIRMAREVGIIFPDYTVVGSKDNLLEDFAKLVAAAEREAVIGICEEWAKSGGDYSLLEAIRARGKE